MKLTLHTFLTLDGVMQSPGGPDEDPDGYYPHGGWSYPYGDEEFGTAMTGWFKHASALLLGRKTYQIFSGYWPKVTDPDNLIADRLNMLPKYVASTTLREVSWHNSSLLDADVPAAVASLKEQPGDELQVHGSGRLAQTLIEHDLVDEFRFLYFPLYLGEGKKLFTDGLPASALKLTGTSATSKGVIIATYQRDGKPQYGNYAEE